MPTCMHTGVHEDGRDEPEPLGLEAPDPRGWRRAPAARKHVPALRKAQQRRMAENSGKSEPLSPSPGFSLPPRALGGRPRRGRGPCRVAGSRLIRRELNEANICLPSLSVPSSLLTCSALMGCDVIPAVVPPPPARNRCSVCRGARGSSVTADQPL